MSTLTRCRYWVWSEWRRSVEVGINQQIWAFRIDEMDLALLLSSTVQSPFRLNNNIGPNQFSFIIEYCIFDEHICSFMVPKAALSVPPWLHGNGRRGHERLPLAKQPSSIRRNNTRRKNEDVMIPMMLSTIRAWNKEVNSRPTGKRQHCIIVTQYKC